MSTKFTANYNVKTIDCPSIHLPRSQFVSQDYDTLLPNNDETSDQENNVKSIQSINELINIFTKKSPTFTIKKIHIVHISDTHLKFAQYDIPFKPNMINILIHSGDLSHSAALNPNGTIPRHYKTFSKWFINLPHHKKVIIAGNHDIAFRQLGSKDKVISLIFHDTPNIYYLQDDTINLYGIKIYGTPWTDKGA